MQEMAESVKQYGVLVHCAGTPQAGRRLNEMVADTAGIMAAELARSSWKSPVLCETSPTMKQRLVMVDSNPQREQILPLGKSLRVQDEAGCHETAGTAHGFNFCNNDVLQKSTGKTSRQVPAPSK
ncbi:MAG: hypothetical protein ACLTLQ_10910 [[Clostridium] scindens]